MSAWQWWVENGPAVISTGMSVILCAFAIVILIYMVKEIRR